VDPTKSGGDLLWAEASVLSWCMPSWTLHPTQLGVGATGDIAVGMVCHADNQKDWPVWQRFNGAGALVDQDDGGGEFPAGAQTYHEWDSLSISQHNDVVASIAGKEECVLNGAFVSIDYCGAWRLDMGGVDWSYACLPQPGPAASRPSSDALGNFFDVVSIPSWGVVASYPAISIDGSVSLPGVGTYLVRAGTLGESFLAGFGDSVAADQTGGAYVSGALPAARDFGCGPLTPAASSSGYLARLDPSWGCVYSRVLPAVVSVLGDATGGALLTATSTAGLDLGCGALPAAAGGSTFITRLDATGACVFGVSVPAPGLTVALDAGGRVVVSGLVGAAPVDLGGGPLEPLGSQDFVLGELDASGSYLWSRRFGSPGVTFAGAPPQTAPVVSIATSGDVYLLTGWDGAVDLGGGPIAAATGDTVVGSYAPSGAYRWGRAFPIVATQSGYAAAIDGCGALVVASTDPSFDVGSGPVLAQDLPPALRFARFAP
jgi:hypothetical protein